MGFCGGSFWGCGAEEGVWPREGSWKGFKHSRCMFMMYVHGVTTSPPPNPRTHCGHTSRRAMGFQPEVVFLSILWGVISINWLSISVTVALEFLSRCSVSCLLPVYSGLGTGCMCYKGWCWPVSGLGPSISFSVDNLTSFSLISWIEFVFEIF